MHSAPLPDFLSGDCLLRTPSGQIVYNYGDESRISSKEISKIVESERDKRGHRKRKPEETPQGGKNRKRVSAQKTPVKLSFT